MTHSNLHLILINDSTLLPSTVDVLQEHFQPDMGINIGFLESFDIEGDEKKIKEATKQCFAILRETKMWAFVEEVVELGCGISHTNKSQHIFWTLKKILNNCLFEQDTTLLIHGSLADVILALSILTDAGLKEIYNIELTSYSATYTNSTASFVEENIPQVNNNYTLTV